MAETAVSGFSVAQAGWRDSESDSIVRAYGLAASPFKVATPVVPKSLEATPPITADTVPAKAPSIQRVTKGPAVRRKEDQGGMASVARARQPSFQNALNSNITSMEWGLRQRSCVPAKHCTSSGSKLDARTLPQST